MIEYKYTEDIASQYGVSIRTVRDWIAKGLLPETTRRVGRYGRGAPYEWTTEQLADFTPPSKGRPAKQRHTEPRRNRIGMWTVAQASEHTGYSESRLRSWVRSGYLRGFDYAGRVYLWPDHLRDLQPPKRGRPVSEDISEQPVSEDAWEVPVSESASESVGHSESAAPEGTPAPESP